MKLTGRIFMVVLGAMLAFQLSAVFAQTNFWSRQSTPLDQLYFRTYQFVFDSRGDIFAATSNGILRSTDNGLTWTQALGTVYSIAIDLTGNVFAASFNGLFRSTDTGETWLPVNLGLTDTRILSVTVSDSGHLWVATGNGLLMRSKDVGNTWQTFQERLLPKSYITSIAAAKRGTLVASSADLHIYVSSNFGKSWGRRPPSPGPHSAFTITPDGEILSAVLLGSGGKYYTGVYRSTNDGHTFRRIARLPGSAEPKHLAADGNGNIFLSTENQGIIRSTDNGVHWSALNSGLTDSYIDAVAMSPGGYVYASGGNGAVYRSETPVLPGIQVRTTDQQAEGMPSLFSVEQNYPNPFNPTTTIEFELAQDALVTATVYNIIGQEVAELIHSELMDEGMQELEFDASNLPSGVYYYKIVAADVEGKSVLYSNVRKMLLLR